MQKSLVFAILAPMVYALANVILEQRFTKFNNLTLIVVYGSVILACAIVVRVVTKNDDPTYAFPSGLELQILMALGLLFFVGDYLFIGAFTNGGDLATITILMVLFPVFASLFKFTGSLVISSITYALPNWWIIGGYVLAACAVVCVVKGSS